MAELEPLSLSIFFIRCADSKGPYSAFQSIYQTVNPMQQEWLLESLDRINALDHPWEYEQMLV